MAGTFTKIVIHIVFGTKRREPHVIEEIREDLQKYITGIVQNNDHKLLEIFCMPDHAHILVDLRPRQSISDLVRLIKTNSSKWLNESGRLPTKFNWQGGFGAFSCSPRDLDDIHAYIRNQPSRHAKTSFRKEYEDFMVKYGIEFEKRYLLG